MCVDYRYHIAQSIDIYSTTTWTMHDIESLSAVCMVEISTLLRMALLSVDAKYTCATNTAVHYVALV